MIVFPLAYRSQLLVLHTNKNGRASSERVEQRLAALEARVTQIEDVNAIRRLQWAYGYYIDYNRPTKWPACLPGTGRWCSCRANIAGMRGSCGSMARGSRTCSPAAGAGRSRAAARPFPVAGRDHRGARWADREGRFRGILAGGWHDAILADKPEGMPQQFWESGIYENDYVKEDGVWKIRRLDYMMQWQADYETGWG
jgi:hypothetical protein